MASAKSLPAFWARMTPEERKAKKREYSQRYYAKHREKVIAAATKWGRNNKGKRAVITGRFRQANRDAAQALHRLDRYGLSPDDHLALRSAQHDACAICGDSFEFVRECIDHDHETGHVRGLLCNSCNGGLGLFLDDIGRLQMAITYLQERLGRQYGRA